MKKIEIILILLCFSLNALCQQQPKNIRLAIPKGTTKIDEEQLKRLSHDRFDDKRASDFHDHIYKKGNLLIYYLYLEVGSAKLKRTLENRQQIMIGVFKQYSKTTIVDSAQIITMNDMRFSIIHYHENDVYYIKFNSDYDKNLQCINGFIEYKKQEEGEAQQYLHDFLNSMHFEK